MDLSLEEIIRRRKQDVVSGLPMANLTLEETVRDMKNNPLLTQPTLTPKVEYCQLDPYSMSLDDIILERLRATRDRSLDRKPEVGTSSPIVTTKTEQPIAGCSKAVCKLDPCASSLEEIIKEKKDSKRKWKAGEIEEPNSPAVMNMDLDGSQPFNRPPPSLSPFRAIGFLFGNGLTIDVAIGRLGEDGGDRSHLWQCIVSCAGIKVKADSARKVVAREMASKEFLFHLGQMYEHIKIPEHLVYEELFIDPHIHQKVEKEACNRAKEVCYEIHVKPVEIKVGHKRRVHYVYICTYFVGTDKFRGEHYMIEYAKVLAAKEAYTQITGKTYYPTSYFVGDDCWDSSLYKFGESEIFQLCDRLENTEADALPSNPNEAKIERARRVLSKNFKKAQQDDEDRRRNMPVDVASFATS